MKLNYCYHTHNYRCGHAVGSFNDYIEEFERLGYTSIGFSDHAFFPGISHRGMRGDFSEIDSYIKEFNEAKEQHKNLNLFLGFEVEYMDRYDSYYDELFTKYNFDYLIIGQHLSYNEKGEIVPYFGFNLKDNLEGIIRYKNDLIKAIRSGKFLYIAHPDIFMYSVTKITPEILDICEEIVKTAHECNVPLELNIGGTRYYNLKSQSEGTNPYPNYYFWQFALKYPVDVVVGLDVHNPLHIAISPLNLPEYFIQKFNLNLLTNQQLEQKIAKIKARYNR